MSLAARLWAELKDARTRPRATLLTTIVAAAAYVGGKAMLSALWQVAVAGN